MIQQYDIVVIGSLGNEKVAVLEPLEGEGRMPQTSKQVSNQRYYYKEVIVVVMTAKEGF